MHGLGEHSGRYPHVGAAFAEAGYALVGFDLRGHGRTPGRRGYAPSFKTLMEDIDVFLDFVKSRYPDDTPVFQYGHSLGGLLVAAHHLYAKPQVAGVMLTAPGFATPLTEQKGKIWMVNTLSPLLPKMIIPTDLDVNTLSRDVKVVDAYIKDPLAHDKTSLSFAKAALQAIDFSFSHAAQFEAPLLIMHGAADRLTYPRGGQSFMRLVASKDAVFKTWDGLYHELHNEPEQKEVIRAMLQWMEARLPGAK